MEIDFSRYGKEDIIFFKKSGDKVILKKIRELLESIKKSPYQGIGKPEPLRFELSGKWSRRINRGHSIVKRPLLNQKLLNQQNNINIKIF